MACSHIPPLIARMACAASSVLAVASTSAALASQGPGTGTGTATGFTQFVMAMLVYGGAAVVVCAGLIGALTRRRTKN